MKVGDVLQTTEKLPEEPPVGATVKDGVGDLWYHTSTDRKERWKCIARSGTGEGLTWTRLVHAWAPLTVTELPVDLTPEPRYLAIEDVRVGMRIRVTQTWPDGSRVIQGLVTAVGQRFVSIGGKPQNAAYLGDAVTEIVLLEPAPMSEPPAPALVRHAGRLWARGEHEDTGVPWHILSGPPVLAHGARLRWVCWADLLALDPAHAPEIVEV